MPSVLQLPSLYKDFEGLVEKPSLRLSCFSPLVPVPSKPGGRKGWTGGKAKASRGELGERQACPRSHFPNRP